MLFMLFTTFVPLKEICRMRKLLPCFLLIFLFSSLGCQQAGKNENTSAATSYLAVAGETMGTTYHITYKDSLGRNFKTDLDFLLQKINEGVSTYIKDSEISKFNQAGQNVEVPVGIYFLQNLIASKEIFEKTNGFFDPTVMPLVNYWGFGYTAKKPVERIDSMAIDSIQQLVGFEKINSTFEYVVEPGDKVASKTYSTISKSISNVQLDFSAIAKGYAVDILSDFFEGKKINNYLVEIGGEIRCKGKNPKGKTWTTAINTPRINAKLTDYEAIIKVANKAIASSGNYRNFHEVNGEWYGHEINPKTGFPEKSKLLSVTVMTDNCAFADGYATAFMVMGLEKSKSLANQLNGIDAFFIFANEKGELEQTYTKGFEGIILN